MLHGKRHPAALGAEDVIANSSTAEFFKLCEKSIDDRTRLVVEPRGLYPEIDSELRTNLIDHLTAENEVVRQKIAFYRKQLALKGNVP